MRRHFRYGTIGLWIALRGSITAPPAPQVDALDCVSAVSAASERRKFTRCWPFRPASTGLRNLRLDLLLILCIVLISLAEFSALIWSKSFGPEFCLYFMFTHREPFLNILIQYLHFEWGWYRPTQFLLPYWIGDRFLDWHDLGAWRCYELLTMLAVCLLIYFLVLQLLPGRRTAAFFAALYFTCVPTIYAPLHELFAFDFLHIVFTLICAVTFIASIRASGTKSLLLCFLSWIAYVVALTSKEITIVIPVFLMLTSIILLTYEPRTTNRRRDLLREALRLVPFWTLVPIYWIVHVRRVAQNFANGGDYRLGVNWRYIVENLGKYPLWFARIYGMTPDHANQAAGHINRRNELVGAALLLLVITAWIRLWRADSKHRKYFLLAGAWMGVFLIVPVYSGGYFWHGNLALCGYCMLFGVAVEWGLNLVPSHKARWACATLLVAGTIVLTRVDAARGLASGYFSTAFRVNSTVLTAPPLPLDRISGNALVYVEDRQPLGNWFFGVGSLFNLVYRDRELHQETVPRMDWIEANKLSQWLKHPNAFFFRYDDQFRWHDATEEFRRFANENVARIAPPPAITALALMETRAGRGFNVQPDGTSAMGIRGENLRPGSTVMINGVKAVTGFVSPEFITATVPLQVYSHPGNATFQVQDSDGQVSSIITFRVTQ
jgi:hypothetical protein